MIIDKIIDRKEGVPYSPKQFYNDISQYEGNGFTYGIAEAMDSGTNRDVQKCLADYITQNGYNPELIKYINAQIWV